ncbi:MAG: shikimate dehydrogenase [Candidatus Aureabacteria bacterium]|nr:shikimate dehydrogenase [Candidatus Auribacterota bacterium]
MDETIRKFGIIGYPLSHTLSPRMHHALFQHYGLKAQYDAFEIDPDHWMTTAPQLRSRFEGFNVTLPYKEKILAYLDFVDETAAAIGAVNTVYYQNGKWCGINTDWRGLRESWKKDYNIHVEGMNVVLFGTSGAARACLKALEGAKFVRCVFRTRENAENMVNFCNKSLAVKAGLNQGSQKELDLSLEEANLIINATSIGLKPGDQFNFQKYRFDFQHVSPSAFVYDIIYSPCQTDLLKRAKERGCRTGNGKGMLVRQGAYAFEKWTGIKPDIEIMREAAGFESLRE